MKIGGVHFNPESFKNFSEQQFKTMFKGKLEIDINEAWKSIKEFNGTKETKKKKIKESPESKKFGASF